MRSHKILLTIAGGLVALAMLGGCSNSATTSKVHGTVKPTPKGNSYFKTHKKGNGGLKFALPTDTVGKKWYLKWEYSCKKPGEKKVTTGIGFFQILLTPPGASKAITIVNHTKGGLYGYGYHTPAFTYKPGTYTIKVVASSWCTWTVAAGKTKTQLNQFTKKIATSKTTTTIKIPKKSKGKKK